MNRMHPQDLRAIGGFIYDAVAHITQGETPHWSRVDEALAMVKAESPKAEPVTDFKADDDAEWEEAYYQKLHLDAMERAVKNTREALGAKDHEATEVAAKRVMAEMDWLKAELKAALESR